VHFSSRSDTDNTYTDAIDVNALLEDVSPSELIYGTQTGAWDWAKTDHCKVLFFRQEFTLEDAIGSQAYSLQPSRRVT
jgi:hypothetical protein